MAFAWKMLIPLALINIMVVAVEVFVWRYWDVTDWVLAAFVAINFAVAVLAIVSFLRIITASYYRLPRRVRLMHEISVPSLPAPGTAAPS